MRSPMRISLRAGERFYINGAVIRAGHKTTIELLNDASFLLEGHVLQPEDATTPLRQLYFALQTLFIDPTSSSARDAYLGMYAAAGRTFTTADVLVGLRNAAKLTEEGRTFEALRTIRNLFPLEERILGGVSANAA